MPPTRFFLTVLMCQESQACPSTYANTCLLPSHLPYPPSYFLRGAPMYARQGKSTGRHLTHMQKGAESLEVGELGSAAGSLRSVDLPRLSFMRSIHRERTLCSPQTYVIAHELLNYSFGEVVATRDRPPTPANYHHRWRSQLADFLWPSPI